MRVARTFAAVLAMVGCTPSPRMCVAEAECGGQATCVAGRCVARGASPAIDSARRLLFSPVDVGWTHRGAGGDEGASASIATLGRGDGGTLFLRFSIPLPRETTVLEAYLLLDRIPESGTEPASLLLHAARVVGPWDARSLTWGTQPSVEEVGSPVTRVSGSGGGTVRIEVRDLLQRWRHRERDDFGVAIVAEGRSPTGVGFALEPWDVPADRRDPALATATGLHEQLQGPRLEAYVR